MSDSIIRATAADNRIRAFAASTRGLVEEARARHNTSPVVTAALGRLLTAAAMMGATLKREDERLTLRIEGDGPVRLLIAQSDAHANVRGYAAEPCVLLGANEKGKLDVAGAVGKGFLRVTRQGGSGEPFTGTSELVSGEIAEDLTYYYALSEQTPSAVALGVLMNHDNTVRAAGGFILQLMPGADEELIASLESRLAAMKPVSYLLADGATPEELLRRALEGFDVAVNETIPTRFHCGCTRESVERVLLSLGCKELSTLAGKPVEVHCDYCNTYYEYSAEEVGRLLASLKDA